MDELQSCSSMVLVWNHQWSLRDKSEISKGVGEMRGALIVRIRREEIWL